MIYVMSDLHGNYEKYKEMLEKIKLSDRDSLFILGDVLDRGVSSMKIILDLIYRPNIYMLAGNHDIVALSCINSLKSSTKQSENAKRITDEWLNVMGGQATYDEYNALDEEEQEMVEEYLSELEFFDEVEVKGRKYVLVHTLGLNNFEEDKPLDEYTQDDILWQRCDYNYRYYNDKFLVTGHTPTSYIENNARPDYIYIANNHIALDCGMERLGCICLDNMVEYYV